MRSLSRVGVEVEVTMKVDQGKPLARRKSPSSSIPRLNTSTHAERSDVLSGARFGSAEAQGSSFLVRNREMAVRTEIRSSRRVRWIRLRLFRRSSSRYRVSSEIAAAWNAARRIRHGTQWPHCFVFTLPFSAGDCTDGCGREAKSGFGLPEHHLALRLVAEGVIDGHW